MIWHCGGRPKGDSPCAKNKKHIKVIVTELRVSHTLIQPSALTVKIQLSHWFCSRIFDVDRVEQYCYICVELMWELIRSVDFQPHLPPDHHISRQEPRSPCGLRGFFVRWCMLVVYMCVSYTIGAQAWKAEHWSSFLRHVVKKISQIGEVVKGVL